MVDDDDGDGFPSLEHRTDSRSALPGGFRAWRRLRIVKRDDFFSLIFLPKTQYMGVELESERQQGAQEVGARTPTLVARWWLPWPSSLAGIFLIF